MRRCCRRTARAALVFVVLTMSAVGPPAVSAQAPSKEQAGQTVLGDRVSLEVFGGTLRGQAREIVYEPRTGHKDSELFWKIGEAFVVGGALAVRPLDWLTLRLGGWTPVKSDNSMDDYDWQVSGRGDWSDWSWHPDTRLRHLYQIDLGASARVASFGKTAVFDEASLSLLAGYRWFNASWAAYGGGYIYSSNPGFRDTTGMTPPGSLGITYQQWIETPYLGVGGTMKRGRWTFVVEATGSLWARARDEDNHHERDTFYQEYFKNMAMVSGDVSFAYALTKSLDMTGRFVYTKYLEVQGPANAYVYSTGQRAHNPGNASGMDFESMLFQLGLRWRMF